MAKIFVCMACGKMSHDRYGENPITRGWDESCMMNSIEVDEEKCVLGDDGRVTNIISVDEKERETDETMD